MWGIEEEKDLQEEVHSGHAEDKQHGGKLWWKVWVSDGWTEEKKTHILLLIPYGTHC